MLKNLKARYSKIKNSKKGFTLIELVVVIAIMAILALIMVPNLTAYIQKGDDAQVKANMKNLHTAAELTIQSDPNFSLAEMDDVTDKTGKTTRAAILTEVGKFANVLPANLEFAAAPSAIGKYAISADGEKIMVKYNTDKKNYSFNGVVYTPAN